MKSKWNADGGEAGANSPVEMRFIDMFMTAVGSLVFVAIVLIIVLPKMTATELLTKTQDHNEKERQKEREKERERETERLRDAKQKDHERQHDLNRKETESIYTLRKWLAIQVAIHNCNDAKFELYVRTDGTLVDPFTNMPFPDDRRYAKAFDVNAPHIKTILFGEEYSDVARDVLNISSVEGYKQPEIQIKLFNTVIRGDQFRTVYLAASDPNALANKECVVRPLFNTWGGISLGRKIVITRLQPFAWLHRFKVNADGTSTIRNAPETDFIFLEDLGNFSISQSANLCSQRSICYAEDAHLHALRLAGITSPTWPTSQTFERFQGKAYRWRPGMPASDLAETREECEARCQQSESCGRYTYFRKTDDSKLAHLSQRCRLMEGSEELVNDIRAESGEKIRFQDSIVSFIERKENTEFWGTPYREISASFDECSRICLNEKNCAAVEYHKGKVDTQCRLFDRVPSTKPRGTVDIGVKRRSS